MKVSSRRIPLHVLTPLGYFKFDDCTVDYRVRVDSSGRTWTDSIVVEGSEGGGCGDVGTCWAGHELPWRGSISSDGDGGFVHRMDMCVLTCIGFFEGELVMRLVPEGDVWRTEAVDGGGRSGIRLDGPLTTSASVDIRAADSTAMGPPPRRVDNPLSLATGS